MIFKANPRFGLELQKKPAHRAMLIEAANAVKTEAEQLAPRGSSRRGVAERFVVEQGAEVRVGNTDPFFHLVEWGSVNNPPFAPLRRAVRAAGLHLDEQSK